MKTNKPEIDPALVREIANLLSESDLTEIEVQREDLRIRVVRQPGGLFQIHVTEAIEPPRDANGKIDVEGTMQAITSVIEGWVREHPEQWLWLHRRWREG